MKKLAYRFIYGPNGTDKTEKCMELIKNMFDKYNCIYYFVPEYLSFEAEKRIAGLFGAISDGKVNVTSFKKMYIETVSFCGAGKAKKLTSAGMRTVIAYLCAKNKSKFKILGKAAGNAGFSEVVMRLIQELKTYNISTDDLDNAAAEIQDSLKIKLSDISDIYSCYNEFMADRFIDSQDENEILKIKILENPDIYANCMFIFDGFQLFTPGQFGVISAIAGKSDVVFALTNNCLDSEEDEIYISQNKSVRNIRKTLAFTNENTPIQAEYGDRFKSFPEAEIILNSFLYGKAESYDKKTDKLFVGEFSDQYKETEFVAKKITDLIKQGVRFKDIKIIARDGDRYLPVIESVFNDYEIPVFIDKKINGATQPALNSIIAALDCIKEKYSYESMFSYLKTGFSNIDAFEIDLLENYIIATGIRGDSWLKDWKYIPYISKIFDNDEEFLVKINDIRKRVVNPLSNLKESLDKAQTIEEKCRTLFCFVEEIGLYNKISGMVERFKSQDVQTAAYYGRVWNILLDTIDVMVETLGDIKESTQTFIDLLTMGISMREIGIVPTCVDVVSVVSPENISETPEKYVFVVGMNDGVYPSVMQSEGLLSDRDRATLEQFGIELAQDSFTQAIGENYLILKVLLSAKERLFLSYPIGDLGGGTRFASTFIKRIQAIFPLLETESFVAVDEGFSDSDIVKPIPAFNKYALNLSKNLLSDKWNKAGEWFRQNPDWESRYNMLKKAVNFAPKTTGLDKRIIDKLYEKGLNVSVSSIEQYTRCPFAYFANYTLGLKTREVAEISSADSGSLMHEAIEKLSNEIYSNGFTWKTVPDEFIEKEILKISDLLIIKLEESFDTPSERRVRMFARVKDMIEQSIFYIATHLRAGEFEPLGYEIEFGEGKQFESISFEIGDKKVKLRGKVDRADIYEDEDGRKYVRVIDYKSGEKSFDFSSMLYGLSLQLIVYLDRICEKTDATPAGVLYFRLFDPTITKQPGMSNKDVEAEIDNMHKMSGLVLADDKIISAMDKSATFDSKIIPVKYNNDGTLSKNSSVVSASQFRDMQRHINRIIRQVGKDILKGRTDISPMLMGNQTGCDYCDYKKICLFDKNCGGKYNELKKIKQEEVLEIIGKSGDTGEQKD